MKFWYVFIVLAIAGLVAGKVGVTLLSLLCAAFFNWAFRKLDENSSPIFASKKPRQKVEPDLDF